MTSQQQGKNNFETACKNCVFADYEGKTQTGCKAQRLNLFNENDIVAAHDEEKEFFVIKKLCSYHRPLEWENEESNLERVVEELKPGVSVIVDVTNYGDIEFNRLDLELGEILECHNSEVIIVHPHTFKYKNRTTDIMLNWLGKGNVKFVEYNDTLNGQEIVLQGLNNVSKRFFTFHILDADIPAHMKKIEQAGLDGKRVVSAQSDKITLVMSSVLKFFAVEEELDFYKFQNDIVVGAKSSGMHLEL